MKILELDKLKRITHILNTNGLMNSSNNSLKLARYLEKSINQNNPITRSLEFGIAGDVAVAFAIKNLNRDNESFLIYVTNVENQNNPLYEKREEIVFASKQIEFIKKSLSKNDLRQEFADCELKINGTIIEIPTTELHLDNVVDVFIKTLPVLNK